jgi:hypothetical protein
MSVFVVCRVSVTNWRLTAGDMASLCYCAYCNCTSCSSFGFELPLQSLPEFKCRLELKFKCIANSVQWLVPCGTRDLET